MRAAAWNRTARSLAAGAGAIALGALAAAAAQPALAQVPNPYKQAWDPGRVKPCDRACLVQVMDLYLDALVRKDRSRLPLAEEVWFTENTARLELGEGLLWRAELALSDFRVTAADPVTGQVAVQIVPKVQGADALVAIRLKVERNQITEVEQLIDREVAPQAMELLRRPVPALLEDLPEDKRPSRELLLHAAHAYFDALTGESGAIAPFADDCVRHEQGYRTVNHPPPGGRASPSPNLPDTSTPMGRYFNQLSMMTCAQQIDTKIFSGIKRIWPRRVLILDEQKGLAASFPLFVHDGTRRPVEPGPGVAPQSGLGMVLNMVTMETFAIRDGKIRHVEAFPFVTFPYGLGDGWTPAKRR